MRTAEELRALRRAKNIQDASLKQVYISLSILLFLLCDDAVVSQIMEQQKGEKKGHAPGLVGITGQHKKTKTCRF